VLDLLAQEFRGPPLSDTKFLIRALTSTEAYQRTSGGKVVATVEHKGEARALTRRCSRALPLPWTHRGAAVRQRGHGEPASGTAGGNGDDLLSAVLGGNKSARAGFLTQVRQPDPAGQGSADVDPAKRCP